MKVSRFDDVRGFLERAQSWLLEREAEHNLVLGIARRLVAEDSRHEKPIYLATLEQDGRIRGCAFRTPPRKLGITDIPISAIPFLVEDVAQVYSTLPAVLGPEPATMEFGKTWTARVGGSFTVGMRQRIHVITQVVLPSTPPPGTLRLAESVDVPLIAAWTEAFVREAHMPNENFESRAKELVDSEAFFIWENDGPRSIAAAVGETPNGIRIGYVYTPTEFRGEGYASVAVASLTQRLLDEGRRFCFLYTDLANPTSNAIYRRLGYVPVCDVIDVVFRE